MESTIVSVTKHKITNRGFLKGPMLPLYGSGALTILVATLWVRENVLLVYLFGVIGATALEYVTGVVMEAIFNMRYWDYSDKKFNLNGYICLKSSLFWGVLSVLIVCFLHVPISNLVLALRPLVLRVILIVITLLVVVDTVISFKNAFDFQKLLLYQTIIKKEFVELQSRIIEAKEAFTERSNEKQTAFFEKQEIRLQHLKQEQEQVMKKLSSFKNSALGSFPSATSKRFGDALNDFKDYFNIK